MKTAQFLTGMLIMAAGLTPGQELLAHNSSQATIPADGVVLTRPPEAIELDFSEADYLVAFNLIIGGGEKISLDGELPRDDADHCSVPLPMLEPGVYRVSWRMEGMDTHKLSGEFTFTLSDKG